MFTPNRYLCTDGYKVSHWPQYEKDITHVQSYMNPRGGVWPSVVFYGLQPKLHWLRSFFQESKRMDIDSADVFWQSYFGTNKIHNKAGWEALQQLEYMPLRVRAVPEGSVIPVNNVLFTVENTDARFPWLTNWVETVLMQTWYPITVATTSREIKKLLLKYLELTGASTEGILFKLHDFGFRGCTCIEQACIGGSAHLVNFLGSDTPVGAEYLEYYYKAKITREKNVCHSIPAAEHSTITSWRKGNDTREREAYENMLLKFPDGLVAVVSDSYDINNACKNIWGRELKAHVLDRNGTVVIRPDSGYPPQIVVECLENLWTAFGGETNEKGYRLLNPKVRLIQGDGVDYDMIGTVLHAMYEAKFSADNIAFGMGAALLQKCDRDTQRMAIKCCAVARGEGNWEDVYKDPATDPGKKSHAGRLALIKEGNEYRTVKGPHKDDLLQTVFENGCVYSKPSIYEIRERATV
jgi:nicotinamide phosphoribosyltransferase